VPNIQGSLDVTEFFGELQAPIWESAYGAQSLGGSMAFRRSDYSRSGEVDTWKIGLEFQVFEDLRVRATKSRDVREPTFRELFDAQGGGGSVNDPTMGNKSVQITTTSGGNPNLSPEIGDTVVAGLVYQPSWLDGLSVSADWYQVEVKDAIAQLNNQRIVDECYINNVTQLCGNIERGGANNDIIRVFNYFLNVAQARVEGIDLEFAYRTEPNFFDSEQESLTVRALAGYLIERADTPFGGTPLDVAGAYTTPEWTSNATVNYGIGPVALQLQMRYIHSGLYNINWVQGVDVDDNEIPSHTWFNGQLAYNGETSNGANWTVALNVQNLFDRNPPIIPGFSSRGGAQNISDNYDTLGRRYQLSVNYNF
jgi:iron complex outermembrane receptor protein